MSVVFHPIFKVSLVCSIPSKPFCLHFAPFCVQFFLFVSVSHPRSSTTPSQSPCKWFLFAFIYARSLWMTHFIGRACPLCAVECLPGPPISPQFQNQISRRALWLISASALVRFTDYPCCCCGTYSSDHQLFVRRA